MLLIVITDHPHQPRYTVKMDHYKRKSETMGVNIAQICLSESAISFLLSSFNEHIIILCFMRSSFQFYLE